MNRPALGRLLFLTYFMIAGSTVWASERVPNLAAHVDESTSSEIMKSPAASAPVALASFKPAQLFRRSGQFLTIACTQEQKTSCGDAYFACMDKCGINKTDFCIKQCHDTWVICRHDCGD